MTLEVRSGSGSSAGSSSDKGYTWKAYDYQLNLGVNIEFCVLFILMAIYLLILMIRLTRFGKGRLPDATRRRYVQLAIPYLVGFLLEFIGYIGRILNHKDETLLGPYIMQSITILVAPPFMAATIYMAFGELVKLFDASKHCLVPIKWLTKIFVTGDVLSILLQAAGGGVQSKGTLDAFNLGKYLIIAGLVVQLLFFGGFVLISTIFAFKFSFCKDKNPWVVTSILKRRSWKFMLLGLYIPCIFILIRSIYRMIEYVQGNGGELLSHEVYLFVLDSTMIFFGGSVFLGVDISYNMSRVYLSKNSQFDEVTYNLDTQPLKSYYDNHNDNHDA